jgi:AmmeMemoRadiSam system protein B
VEHTKDYPRLRAVEAISAQDNLVCLRDPEGFSDKLVLLPQEMLFIVSLFDGKHSVLDIQVEYTRRFGTLLFGERVRQIVEQLDAALFLDTPRFHEARREAEASFRSASVRAPSHAGSAYEAEPEAVARQLGELFAAETGSEQPSRPSGPLRGLIAPHIDLRRGGRCFARSYAELADGCEARTFVVLGIAHLPTRRSFILTAKDFQTPLGAVPADGEFIAELTRRCSTDFFEDEFLHRNEHSVEFQALFLRYMYPRSQNLRMVPVLCSASASPRAEGSPEQAAEVEEFIAALKGVLAQYGSRALCIAGVDLSHVGQRFGQQLTLSPALQRRIEEEDRAMIELILARDAAGFLRSIQREGNRRNVCGVPGIYALLRVMEAHSGRLLKYEQAPDQATQSLVSFMAAAFYG